MKFNDARQPEETEDDEALGEEVASAFKSTTSKGHSPRDSPTMPFSMEGLQTVVKNNPAPQIKPTKMPQVHIQEQSENAESEQKGSAQLRQGLTEASLALLAAELGRYREENEQLRTALKEASRVNQQWRDYHDQRQGYVQKLLASLQELQQNSTLAQGGGRTGVELQSLRETLMRNQREHNEYIQLLQLQVKAHRDDWEAERCEKRAAEAGRQRAEAQLSAAHRQLLRANAMLSDTDPRQCKCTNSSNVARETIGEDRRIPPLHYHNGFVAPTENASCRHSPSLGSTASVFSSRSSSVSKDLSSCSSPTINKNTQTLSPYAATNSESTSPSMKVCSKTSVKSEVLVDKAASELNQNNSCGFQKLQESTFAPSKPHQCTHESCTSKPNDSSSDEPTSPSIQYYESKGARPKSSRKGCDDEILLKHRARSILASALPLSPSSSKPSSPVTVSPNKGTSIPKGYVPITSTILTPVKYAKQCSNAKDENKSRNVAKDKTDKTPKNYNAENHTNLNHVHKITENDSAIIKVTNSSNNLCEYHKKSTSPKYKLASQKSNENLSLTCSNEPIEHKQCSSLHINPLNCSKNCHCDQSRHKIILQNDIRKVNSAEIEKEIKYATKMKQTVKPMVVANSQPETFNKNYASITVMPGPSSALYSHTTSAATSRSSSPGISLATFELNANGQGIPGAIYFTMGSDSNSSISPQPNISVVPSVTCTDAHDETKNNTSKEVPETKERIVNSTWVQLMDKEKSSNRPSKNTWRTARVIPSHKLTSVRKNHADGTASMPVSPNPSEAIKQNENYLLSYSSSVAGNMSNYNRNFLQPNYEMTYQTSFSPPPSYASCSRTSPGISLAAAQTSYSQNDLRAANSPSICIIPHGPKTHAEADLRSKASRNISSAILSYECANKPCKASRKLRESQSHFFDQYGLSAHVGAVDSDHCLICPSCQKLFPQGHSAKYAQHLQLCGGPKYADM